MAFWAYRAATVSITPAEAVAFNRWIRPPLRDVVSQPFDTRNHILENLLIKRSVGLLRLSEFSFRLPALLGEALYLWIIWSLARRYSRWLLLLALVPAGLALGLFSLAISLALKNRIENLNLSAASLALAAAANLSFFWPAIAGAAICLLIAARRFGWTVAVERVGLTAIVTGFVLLAIPLSHGSSAPGISLDLPPRDSGARGLLRGISRTTPIRIGAAPEMAPVLEFYKARYRAAGWSIVSPGTPADCYLVEQAGIAVLVRPSQGGAFRPPARFLNFPNQLIPNELLFGHDVAYR